MKRIVEKGFTLVETLVALAIAGVLVAIAVPSYKFYVARTQVTESLSSASMQSFSVAQNLKRGRCTTVAGVNDVYPNRFGTLTISGAKVTSKGENCPSGCTATFLFNDTTEKHLQGKQVVFNILNNQKVSFVSSTVDSLYLPKELKTISTTTTDNCTAIPDQPLTPTDGSTPGGSTTNPTPTAPTPTNPTPTTPPNSTNPTDPTNLTNPTNPTPTNPTPTTPTDPMDGGQTPVPTLVPANCGYLLFSANKPHLYCWKNGGTAELIGNTGGGINQEIFDAGKLFYSRYLTYGCQAEHSYTSGTFYLPKCVDQRVAIEYERKRFGRGWVYRKKGSGGIWVNGDTARAN